MFPLTSNLALLYCYGSLCGQSSPTFQSSRQAFRISSRHSSNLQKKSRLASFPGFCAQTTAAHWRARCVGWAGGRGGVLQSQMYPLGVANSSEYLETFKTQKGGGGVQREATHFSADQLRSMLKSLAPGRNSEANAVQSSSPPLPQI